MNMLENHETDKKSLRIIVGASADWSELSKDCVAFANAAGGRLLLGIENKATLPPSNQKIPDALVEQLRKRIPQLTVNVSIHPERKIAANGGEYIELTVFRCPQSVASTSDGKFYIRVSDDSKPVLPDDLNRLVGEKNAFVWELQTPQKVPAARCDEQKIDDFLKRIHASERVSGFVKHKSVPELLNHYFFVKDGYLTNLGVLWIGKREDRALLQHAPVIQFIKYDAGERKVNKIVWDDYSLNPMELIEAVWTQIPDWRESFELPEGMFRRNVPNYDEVVIRELVSNALVHRPYSMRGDIFINLYPDRFEIHNPGLLPLGVTPANILHTSIKRNNHLAQVFYDLKLMEREGSGYDRIYEVLLTSGKPLPKVTEGMDRVTVSVEKRIVKPEILEFLHRADATFQLRQRELITLGLLAQYESLTAIELSVLLALPDDERLRSWLGRLIDLEVVSKSSGKTRALEYRIDSNILRELQYKGKTTLKRIESPRLQELILQDILIYQPCTLKETHQRIGPEISIAKVEKAFGDLIRSGSLAKISARRWTRYAIARNDGK